MYFQVKGLSFSYGKKGILNDIHLSLNKGEVISIVGPNGAGKTTLLKCMAGIYQTREDMIFVQGKKISGMPLNKRAQWIGYVPQHAPSGFPLTVIEMVLLGRKPYIRWGVRERDIKIVQYILSFLGIEHMANRYIDELSGGERQKVLLARALAQEPEILMLDEPTSALDIRHQLEVLELMKDLSRTKNHMIVLILHDLEWASRYSDRIIMLKEGTVFDIGHPSEVLTEKNIQDVYGVKVNIQEGEFGCKITAIQPA